MGRIIKINYDIGDKIRYKYITLHEKRIQCPCCNGQGVIHGLDDKDYECPECEGYKTIGVGEFDQEVEERTGTICSIHVVYHSNFDSFHNKPNVYYNVPQSTYNIDQENIIEKIVDEDCWMGYTE